MMFQSSNRTPLFAAMAALALLGAGGGYLYSQRASVEDSDSAQSALAAADIASAAAGMSDADREGMRNAYRSLREGPDGNYQLTYRVQVEDGSPRY